MSDEKFRIEMENMIMKQKERIEKLEKDAKDHDLYQQDQYDIIKQELSELKTKIKDIKLGNTAKILNQNKIVADYAELKANSASHTEEMNKRTDHLHDEIHELKEQLRLEKDMRITNTKTMNSFLNSWCNRVKNGEKVLREFFKEMSFHYEVDGSRTNAAWMFFYDTLLKKLGGEKTVNEVNNPMSSGSGMKTETDSKPPSCEFYNIEYCDPCKSPNDITKCDLFQIGTQIKIEKWNPSEQDAGSASARESLDRQTAKIERIIEIYDNGHESVFYPYTHMVVEKEDLKYLFNASREVCWHMMEDKRWNEMKKKYLEEDHE